MKIAGLTVQKRGSTIKFPYDHLIDLVMLFADNLDLSLDMSGQKYFVQYDSIDQDKKNSIDDLLFVGEEHLKDQNSKIKQIQHDRNRKAEFLVQDKRWDIHTTGRCTGPDDNPNGKSDHETTADGGQHLVVCDVGKLRNLFEYAEDNRVKETADQCRQCKHLSKDNCPQHEHYSVEAEDKQGKRNMEIMFKCKSKTCRSPGDQVIWKDEHNNTESIDGVAK